jgi:RimJ/RimL family protein N-acetyltransferase
VDVFIETERMVLRQFTMDDVDAVLALDSDPAVRTFVEDGEPVNRDEVTITIEHWLRYYERSDDYGFWAAIEKSSGEFLGWFHFRPRQGTPSDEPELGYRLVSSAWGKGYATEGSRALIDKGFASPAVSRVVAGTLAAHTASRRVMERSGLRHTRTFPTEWPVRLPGDEHGEVEYAITRAEWEADRKNS